MTQVFHKIVYYTSICENCDVDLINKLPKWLQIIEKSDLQYFKIIIAI